MNSFASVQNRDNARREVQAGAPPGSIRFDLGASLLSITFVMGAYLDGWAHNTGRVDDTFLTPWHAVLYSGWLLMGVYLVGALLLNMRKGYPVTRALPVGYMPALVGVLLFGVGGAFDFWWHDTFGFEVDIEAVLSPSHLLLAASGFLFISAPLRAAWKRRDSAGWSGLFPAILSATAVISIVTFFTQYANFTANPHLLIESPLSDSYLRDTHSIFSILLTTSLAVGVLLFLLRRWELPFGAAFFIFTVNTVLMVLMRPEQVDGVIPVFVALPLAGLLADTLRVALSRSVSAVMMVRLLGFTVPFVAGLVYLLALNAIGYNGQALWWKIHMWLGVPILAGVAGLFISLIAVPPPVPFQPVSEVP